MMYASASLVAAIAFIANTAASAVPANKANNIHLFKRDGWGPAISLGPTTSHIVTAYSITRPGRMPANQTGGLYLWPGMSNGTGDLIQSIVGSQTDNAWCGATPGQWCISSEVYDGAQLGGTLHTGSWGNSSLKISYVHINSTHWQQTVDDYDTKTRLAEYTHASGPMTGWGTAVECNGGCTPTIEQQTYNKTQIRLAARDMSFADTIYASDGATYSKFYTTDKGMTWILEGVVIPAMNPQT